MEPVLALIVCSLYINAILALECGSQTETVEDCDLDIVVQCALDDFDWVYWANAKDQSKKNPYGTGPTTGHYSSADSAGEEAIVLLFQNLGPNRCNCVQKNVTEFGIPFQLDVCYQFASTDDLKNKKPTFKVWAQNMKSKQYGYFCCDRNYTLASQSALESISLCASTLQQANVFEFNVSQEIKVEKGHSIMSSDCHYKFEVDASSTKDTSIKLRQYNVTSGSSYNTMWDFEDSKVYPENIDIFFEGHDDGNVEFKDGNASKVLWESGTKDKGTAPYKFELSMGSGHFKYKDAKGNDIWSVGENKRAD